MKKSLIRIASIVAPILSGTAKALARIRPRIIAYAILPLLLLTGAIATAQAPAEPLGLGPEAINTILLLQQEKAQLAPHEQKIDSRLRRLIDSQRSPPRFPGLAGLALAQPNVDGTIALDIDTFAGSEVKALVDAVVAAGGQVLHASTRYRSARVRLPVSAIIGIAMLPGVRVIYPEHRATNNKVNTSEGDTTHRAAAARAFFGFDGTGVKACVMSSGVDSLAAAQASGEPAPVRRRASGSRRQRRRRHRDAGDHPRSRAGRHARLRDLEPRPGKLRAEHHRPEERRLPRHRRRRSVFLRVAVPGQQCRRRDQPGQRRGRALLLVGWQFGQPRRRHGGHLGRRFPPNGANTPACPPAQ